MFGRKKAVRSSDAAKEAEIEQIKFEALMRMRHAEEQTKKLNTLLDENKSDIALRLFVAMGNDRRLK